MSENMPARYDTTEALEMLGAFAEKTKPDKVGAEDAAEALLEELYLLRLDVKNAAIERPKLRGKTAVAFITEKTSAWVQHVEGKFEIFKGVGRDDPDPATRISLAGLLSYNPAKKILEGVAPEKFRTPLPGGPPARRSALAVVLERVLNLIKADSEPATISRLKSPKSRMAR